MSISQVSSTTTSSSSSTSTAAGRDMEPGRASGDELNVNHEQQLDQQLNLIHAAWMPPSKA